MEMGSIPIWNFFYNHMQLVKCFFCQINIQYHFHLPFYQAKKNFNWKSHEICVIKRLNNARVKGRVSRNFWMSFHNFVVELLCYSATRTYLFQKFGFNHISAIFDLKSLAVQLSANIFSMNIIAFQCLKTVYWLVLTFFFFKNTLKKAHLRSKLSFFLVAFLNGSWSKSKSKWSH
jgi:hypothetical protein